jgi:hypothetical protein
MTTHTTTQNDTPAHPDGRERPDISDILEEIIDLARPRQEMWNPDDAMLTRLEEAGVLAAKALDEIKKGS